MVDYYTKAEIDSQLTDYTTITHLQGNHMTTLSITEALMNSYAAITFLVDNFYSKTEIDSTLSDYITSTQIYDSYYTKSDIGITFIPTICSNIIFLYSKPYVDNAFISSTQTGALYYNKTETIICYCPIVLVLMLVIITFTIKLVLILYSQTN